MSTPARPREHAEDEPPDFTAPEHALAVQARVALGLSAHQAVLLLEGEWWRAHTAARRARRALQLHQEDSEEGGGADGRAREEGILSREGDEAQAHEDAPLAAPLREERGAREGADAGIAGAPPDRYAVARTTTYRSLHRASRDAHRALPVAYAWTY